MKYEMKFPENNMLNDELILTRILNLTTIHNSNSFASKFNFSDVNLTDKQNYSMSIIKTEANNHPINYTSWLGVQEYLGTTL